MQVVAASEESEDTVARETGDTDGHTHATLVSVCQSAFTEVSEVRCLLINGSLSLSLPFPQTFGIRVSARIRPLRGASVFFSLSFIFTTLSTPLV